jgi:photosystem II stability/assembly factor-like uncharacterized protein
MQRLAVLLLCLCAIAHGDWRHVNGPYGYITESLFATETLLLAGNNLGIFRSRDQGASWERRAEGYASRGFAVAGRYILARSVFHVLRSGDEGETWQTIHNGLPDSMASSIVSMGDKVFLGNGHGVYRSLDQGGLWTKSSQNIEDTVIHSLVVEGTALLARTRTTLYRSLDSGSTWHKAGAGLPSELDFTAYRAFARSGEHLFTHVGGRIYRSNDLGATWARAPGALADTNIISLFDDGTRLYLGTMGGLFRSSDQGVSFQKVNGEVGIRLLPLDAAPQGTGFWMATNRGLFHSRDQGATFEGSHTGMNASRADAFLYEGGRLHVASNSEFFSSPDLGATWTRSPDTTLSSKVTSLATLGGVLFAGTEDQGVRKSTDGGKTWLSATNGLELPEERIFALVAEGIYLHAATFNGLYRSANGGGSWSKFGNGLPEYTSAGLAVDGSSLFAWSETRVFRSSDHGSNWIASGDPVPGPIGRLVVAGSTVIVAGGNLIHTSRDRGATWSTLDSALQGDWFTALEATRAGFFVGTGRGSILHSSDSGTTWNLRNEGIGWFPTSVGCFGEAGDQILVGARGIFKRPLAEFGVVAVRNKGPRSGAAWPRFGFALGVLRGLGVDLLGRSSSLGAPGRP